MLADRSQLNCESLPLEDTAPLQLVCLGGQEARTFQQCRSPEKAMDLRLHATPRANRDLSGPNALGKCKGLYFEDSLENRPGEGEGARNLITQTRIPGLGWLMVWVGRP